MREANDNLGAGDREVTESPPRRKPKLFDQLREAVRTRHYAPRTEQTYSHWVRRFIFFHNVRHTHVLNKKGPGVRSPVDGL